MPDNDAAYCGERYNTLQYTLRSSENLWRNYDGDDDDDYRTSEWCWDAESVAFAMTIQLDAFVIQPHPVVAC